MGSTQDGVLEEADEVSLCSLLQSKNGVALQTEINLDRRNENNSKYSIRSSTLRISVTELYVACKRLLYIYMDEQTFKF